MNNKFEIFTIVFILCISFFLPLIADESNPPEKSLIIVIEKDHVFFNDHIITLREIIKYETKIDSEENAFPSYNDTSEIAPAVFHHKKYPIFFIYNRDYIDFGISWDKRFSDLSYIKVIKDDIMIDNNTTSYMVEQIYKRKQIKYAKRNLSRTDIVYDSSLYNCSSIYFEFDLDSKRLISNHGLREVRFDLLIN